MMGSEKYMMIALVLPYVIVYTLLILSLLDFHNPVITFIIYLIGINTGYLAISLYSKNFFIIKKFWGLFIIITLIIAFITIVIYGSVAISLVLLSLDTKPFMLDILLFSAILGNILLSPCLTIHAHINQRNIEKYFHLLYMIFAPILLFFIPDIAHLFYFAPSMDIFINIFIVIILIPPLFVLKNLYLSYRQYKGEKKNLRKDKGDNLKEDKD